MLPLQAQRVEEDSTYLFRFVPRRDAFYLAYEKNDTELQRLYAVLNAHLDRLRSGQMYISVSSYAASAGKGRTADRIAYLRNSRVKSELITHSGVTEQMFATDRRIPSAYGRDSLHDVVVVTLPAGVEKVARIVGPEAAERVKAYFREVYGDPEAERLAAEQARQAEQKQQKQQAAERAEHERVAAEQARREQSEQERKTEQERLTTEHSASSDLQSEDTDSSPASREHPHLQSSLSLRANLLRWATLTPDLGIEWRINHNLGILVNGSWTSWSWDNKNRRYALWKISPEVRYYIGKEKRGYLGAMYHTGEFNYKLGDTGKQGDYQGGGITGGYTLTLNRALDLDFHAAVGYTRAEYDKYTVTDGVRVRAGSDTKNYWGVNQLGVTLVWKFIK